METTNLPSLNAANGVTWAQSCRQLARHALAMTMPRRLLLVQGPATCSSVCLTFDDGPDPDHTARLLDVLKNHQVMATFFVIGHKVERHPDLVRRIAAEGHLVGNHSYSHSPPPQTSAQQLIDELQRTWDLLDRLLGKPARFFRPPHGKVTAGKLWRLWRAGQTVVLWNKDPKDYASHSADQVRDWFRDHPLAGGDVILMHDNQPYAPDVIEHLAQEAARRRLTFTTPGAWTR